MPRPDVKMSYPQMEGAAKKFDAYAHMLQNVNSALKICAERLENTAFIGEVGGAAYVLYINLLRLRVERLAQVCAEFAVDIRASIEDHKTGDQNARARFGEGVQRG
jgi:hypothetical protein